MIKLKIKICCIQNLTEANLAIRMGATAIGLVGPMPSGPGVIARDEIPKIAKAIPGYIDRFLLSSARSIEQLVNDAKHSACNVLQIVDYFEGDYQALKAQLPDVKIVQVIHVEDETAIRQAKSLEGKVDMLLLDSGKPSSAVKELGGTGRAHDWTISRKIVESVDLPVYLAGGLNAENVRLAVEQVNPYGVDLCSSVRTMDQLDFVKLNAFMDSLKSI